MTNRQEEFRKKVWDFYKENKRDFPWRNTTYPYEIFVSEIMLQQTQTSRVIEKYNNFLQKFPSLKDLATATQADVLKEWQGLGYNRRGLYLKKTAEIIVNQYNTIFPQTREELVLLPGIGTNTAGSILAFAFNIPVVFIETNIRRAFIHEFFEEQVDVDDKEILQLVEQTLDHENPREWYYALMDYGNYLAKNTVNPNRKSKHYAQQSKFEGSLRQTRGRILKLLLDKNYDIKLLDDEFEDNEHVANALEQLMKEGFIEKVGTIIRLKS